MHYIRLGAALLAVVLACGKPTGDDAASRDAATALRAATALPASDTATDPELHQLEREAFVLANPGGCVAVGQCRAAPVGNRPCGGPRYYFAYCPLTTDSAALFRKLGELSRAEGLYNQRRGLASTCEYRGPPDLIVDGATCRFR